MMGGFASQALRIATAGILLLADAGGIALAQQRVGVNSAVNPEASGTPPGAATRRLVIGQEVLYNERIATGPAGQTQLLFLDESSMSIGPNSDLTIDQFVYDPKSGTGKVAMSATKGLLRYVGGKLSKQDEGVTLRTSTATLAVRGGAFLVNIGPDGQTEAIFIYGKGLTIIGNGGSSTITRPGYHVTVGNGPPSSPSPTPPGELAALLQQLDGRSGGTGGAPVVPTDTLVASSGVPQTISGNLPASIQQAEVNSSTGTQANFLNSGTPTTNPSSEQTNLNPQPNPLGGTIDCVASGGCNTPSTNTIGMTTSGQQVGGTSLNTGSSSTSTTTTTTPTPPPTVTISYAGRLKNTNGHGTTRGFFDQSANGDIPYTGGVLSFPQGSPQQGVFTATVGGLGNISFPLVPGSASFANGTSSTLGPLTGTTFLSANNADTTLNNTFFYASITPTNQPAERLFIFGGTPVSTGFYQPTGSTRVFAYDVQPDAALQSNAPFVRSQAGGNLPNGNVSPFYVVAPASTAIGNTSGAVAARGMQASLAINGQGANQQSTIAVTGGAIGTQNGQPVFTGQMRGSSMQSAFGTPVRLDAAVGSAVDGAGNSFYGGNSVSGFVVNQTSPASETPLSGTATTYGFAQPAVTVPLPTGVTGANRTTQTLTGNFGGLMYTTAQGTPYVVGGTTSLSTDAATNRVAASFTGAPQTSAAGVSNLTMQYGGLTGAAGSQAFIDNNNYAAAESQTMPQQIAINGTTSQPTGQLYMVSSGAAGTPTSILPNGASYCQCQYLQWGYWGGDLSTPNGTATPRIDRGHINTWVAGVATPLADLNNLAGQSAVGSYTGHAIGSVFNNGASYVAAGGFNATYNFGTQNGTFTLSNFDGRTVSASGSAPLNGAKYGFTFTNPGVQGTVNGTFYGPNAAETGGNFGFQTTVGPTYQASGIYAGKR